MKIRIIRESKVIESVQYRLFFPLTGKGYSGFSFPCDEDGNVDTAQLNPDALYNYTSCLTQKHVVGPSRVETERHTYTQPRIGRCECGEEIYLDRYTNSCDCGIDYDSAGYALAPREQWGEETGESVSDILSADKD